MEWTIYVNGQLLNIGILRNSDRYNSAHAALVVELLTQYEKFTVVDDAEGVCEKNVPFDKWQPLDITIISGLNNRVYRFVNDTYIPYFMSKDGSKLGYEFASTDTIFTQELHDYVNDLSLMNVVGDVDSNEHMNIYLCKKQ